MDADSMAGQGVELPNGARLIVARDLDDLSARAAQIFITLAQRSGDVEGSRFAVALSGGETPKRLYNLLASAPYADQVPWPRVHVFWGDERHVPPDDAESNYRMAREALLDKVPILPENVHRVRGEIHDAAEAARAYEDDLRGLFDLPPDSLPRFDLLLLGMGPDGHTASLFPGTDVLHDTAHLVAAPWVAKFNTYRITLTPKVLNNAAATILLVSGANKASTLREVLQGERRPDQLPVQLIAPTDGALIWLADRDAVAQLDSLAGNG